MSARELAAAFVASLPPISQEATADEPLSESDEALHEVYAQEHEDGASDE